MNYFELFSLSQGYILDKSSLKKSYFSLQEKCHPDRSDGESERMADLERSMAVNEAFKVLNDDYLRAEYLLRLKGNIPEDLALKNILPAHELAELMEQYESIEAVVDPLILAAVEKVKTADLKKLVQELGKLFAENNLERALELTIRLKYLTNLLGNIRLKIRSANN